jgi:hypothetical protein
MKRPKIEQFNLFAPSSGCESSFITFEGCEWPDLLQASYSIRKHYGRQFAVEIKDRFFVLTAQEMLRIKETGISCHLGFYDDDDVVILSCHDNSMKDYLQWITQEERSASEDWRIFEHDAQVKQQYLLRRKGIQACKIGNIGEYKFMAEIYDTPSEYGVRGGNIMKLELQLVATDEHVACFNHEWLSLPDNVHLHLAIETLVDHYRTTKYATPQES